MNDDFEFILSTLKSMASSDHFDKLKRFGINQKTALGVQIPAIRNLAKSIGVNSELATQLLTSNIHEAKILASIIDDPKQLTEEKVEQYISRFDSWDVCDQTCNLLQRSVFSEKLIFSLYNDNEEFRKRTAFVIICSSAVHNKKAPNNQFLDYLELIEKEAWDERNFVRKAVNWALRQIGKRNIFLHQKAIECAERIQQQPFKSAKWIARDALRELHNEKIISRLLAKEKLLEKHKL
jgi:3-methyladenine DNA glycosylase AlkD